MLWEDSGASFDKLRTGSSPAPSAKEGRCPSLDTSQNWRLSCSWLCTRLGGGADFTVAEEGHDLEGADAGADGEIVAEAGGDERQAGG